MANVAQGAATFAVYFLTKNKKMKGLASSSGVSALLGVTEPALFGVNLKYKFPFFCALIGSGVAAAFDYKDLNDTTRTYKVVSEPEKIAQIVKQTSPIYAVTSDDPPVLIIHGDADRTVPLQQSENLVKKLKESKISNQLIIKNGGGHGWQNIENDERAFFDWFDKYLK